MAKPNTSKNKNNLKKQKHINDLENGELNIVKEDSQAKNLLAVFLALLFVLALAATTFIYFNNSSITETIASKLGYSLTNIFEPDEDQNKDTTQNMEGKNATEASKESQNTAAILEGANTSRSDNDGQVAGTSISNQPQTEWTANNYTQGEIKKGEYKVQDGDTLWELAEGAYGDGSQWEQIAQANADNIQFNSNGQQSLIFSGQTIVIP